MSKPLSRDQASRGERSPKLLQHNELPAAARCAVSAPHCDFLLAPFWKSRNSTRSMQLPWGRGRTSISLRPDPDSALPPRDPTVRLKEAIRIPCRQLILFREVSAPGPTVRGAVSRVPVCAPGLRQAAAEGSRACAEFPARQPAPWQYRPPSAAAQPRIAPWA